MPINKDIYEDKKLISLLNEGDESAFNIIYDRYRNRIYSQALRYLSSPVIAQEIVQDVFLKLWLERADIRKEAPVEAWLFVVARNLLINQLKKMARDWKALDLMTAGHVEEKNSVFDNLKEKEYEQLLNQVIEELPEKQRLVYQLARFDQMPYVQIARYLNISPLTVKTHMARALQHIRSFLAEKGVLFLAFYFFC